MTPDKLGQIAAAAFDHAAKKLELKERAEQQLMVAYNGGMFKATQQLMNFLTIEWNWQNRNDMIIEDVYSNPIQVERLELLEKLNQAYQFTMNQWHTDYEELLKIRNGKNV
jgi:hypothetical protein